MLNVSGFSYMAFFALVVAGLSGTDARAADLKTPETKSTETAGEVVSVEGVVFIRQDGKVATAALKPARPGDKLTSGDVINTSSNGKIKLLLKDKSIVDLGPSALFKMDNFKANGGGAERQADLSMMYGTMRVAVTQKINGKGRFNVRTPTATMGVRGTEFVVKSEVKSLDDVRQVLKNPEKPLPSQANAAAGPTTAGKDGAAAKQPIAKTEITVIQGKVEVAKPEAASGRGPASAKPEVVALTAGMQISTKQTDTQMAKPVTLDNKQLASLASVAKVSDNTFTRAVVVDLGNNSGSSSGSNGGGYGEATLAAVTKALEVAPPPAAPPTAGPLFPMPNLIDTPNFNQQAGIKRLRVIVVTP